MSELKKVFTFPDSGKTVTVPVISFEAVALRVQRRNPPPSPPLQKVDFGDGKIRYEKNYAHPDYKVALEEMYPRFVQQEATRMGLQMISNFEMTEEMSLELAKWKDDNPSLWDDQDGDRDLWLENIGIRTTGDFNAWMKFMEVGDPSEEGTKAVQDGFQG